MAVLFIVIVNDDATLIMITMKDNNDNHDNHNSNGNVSDRMVTMIIKIVHSYSAFPPMRRLVLLYFVCRLESLDTRL